jgi:hypothetical protein
MPVAAEVAEVEVAEMEAAEVEAGAAPVVEERAHRKAPVQAVSTLTMEARKTKTEVCCRGFGRFF